MAGGNVEYIEMTNQAGVQKAERLFPVFTHLS